MKKSSIVIAALCLATLLAACGKMQRHTTIIENNNGSKVKIEYQGQTYFSADGTSIENISPYGYVKYSRNDRELKAESDSHVHITYEFNDGDKQTVLTAADKDFVAQAVRDMIKHGHNTSGR
ncbi:hypothetical protein [Mucilaginibacter sp. SP1R1]|uniref:hypothetical protein n=1 Tax=Mucilaginibacter sp. SP1R1 TaxID=2723091 RepID=UPI0016144AF1|nr:hypothetical protein [Mucilaginibacter sp. SP1R1]MBB6151183.1 YHS domain-containing protein [Mucilaginibacter sp. SP1R1]